MNRPDSVMALLVTLVAALLLSSSPASAHTGEDNFFNETWQRDLTVQYRFGSGFPTGNWRGRVRDGAKEWKDLLVSTEIVEGPDLSSNHDPTSCSPSYQRNGIFYQVIDGAGGTLAATFRCWSNATDEMWSANIVFDRQENWYTGTGSPGSDEFDAWSLASHEFGHFLGFSPHFDPDDDSVCPTTTARNTMCPTIGSGTTRWRDLEGHDLHTTRDSYPLAPGGQSALFSDFDGDGFGDLAVGVPGDSRSGAEDAGVVNVVYGSSSGLTSAGDDLWAQDLTGVPGGAEHGDRFGAALAAGDFDGDGFSDLAVGAPGEDNGGGGVWVFYGSGSGLTDAGIQVFKQGRNGVAESKESFDRFGNVLAAGDFNADGSDDLAVSATHEDHAERNEGVVQVLYGEPVPLLGSSSGLTTDEQQVWRQGSAGLVPTAEDDDRFGTTLASGDFDGDATDDLVIGSPYESKSGHPQAGTFDLLYGEASSLLSFGGLTSDGNEHWHQGRSAVGAAPEHYDRFAWALAAGDFDGDDDDDLAVGVPDESVKSRDEAGFVQIWLGGSNGLSFDGGWHQGTSGIESDLKGYDRFGAAVASGNMDGDDFEDLIVGAPDENLPNGTVNAGAVHVIYGSSSGLTSSGDGFWHQDSSGVDGAAEHHDRFGLTVAASNYNGPSTGRMDVTVGVVGESIGSAENAGAVQIFYGGVVTSDQFISQSSSGISGGTEDEDRLGSAFGAGG